MTNAPASHGFHCWMLCGRFVSSLRSENCPRTLGACACLTLMLAAAANATATPAPARHLWFANGFSRRAFRYPAHAANVVGYRTVFELSSRPVMSRFRRGVRQGQNLVASRLDKGERSLSLAVTFLISAFRISGFRFSPWRHRADACVRASRQASARFRQCPLPDSTFSARSIHCRTPLHRLRGLLSLIPTAANCRDRHGFMRALPLIFVGSLRSWIVCSRCSKK